MALTVYLDATIVLDLHSRDASTQQVVAKFAIADPPDRIDREGEMFCLSHIIGMPARADCFNKPMRVQSPVLLQPNCLAHLRT
jgi:hypothetical protein